MRVNLTRAFPYLPNDEDALLKQLDEYEHNLRRIFINRGISMESMSPQVSDPSSHVDIQIQMISAQTGIPKRILTGSERGSYPVARTRINGRRPYNHGEKNTLNK